MACVKILLYAALFGVLVEFAQGHCCVAESLKCVKPLFAAPKKTGLHETSEALDQECRIHEEFFRCVDQVVDTCKLSTEEGADQFAESRKMVWELCSEESEFRYKFLQHARCINKITVDSCNFLVALDAIGKADTCSFLIRKTLCIKNRVKEKCGRDSSYLMKQVIENIFADNEECRIRQLAEENFDSEESLDRDAKTLHAPEVSEERKNRTQHPENGTQHSEEVLLVEDPSKNFEESSLIEEVASVEQTRKLLIPDE